MSLAPSITHSTFVIERTYPATPERVFDAFADPAKKRRWFAESKSAELLHYELDFREGGQERASLRLGAGPVKGMVMANHTTYQDIVPNSRIVFAYTMSLGDRHISASLVSIELLPADGGTQLVFTEQAAFFPQSDGPAIREAGWRQILEGLIAEL